MQDQILPCRKFWNTLRTAAISFAVCSSLMASPAADPFAGTWRFNHQKSALKQRSMSIVSQGDNRYRILYNDVCSVEIGVLCGSEIAFEVKADGTDQPHFPSTTWGVTIKDPRTWEIRHKTNGKIIGIETWALSLDATSLSRTFGSNLQGPGGSAISSAAESLKRLSGSGGFAGTWWIKDVSESNPYEKDLEIQAPAGGVLGVSYPTMTITFDGTEFPIQAPQWLPTGSAAIARRNSSHSVQITYKFAGKVLDTSIWNVSPDGKVLRVADRQPGKTTPTISVYDRR